MKDKNSTNLLPEDYIAGWYKRMSKKELQTRQRALLNEIKELVGEPPAYFTFLEARKWLIDEAAKRGRNIKSAFNI